MNQNSHKMYSETNKSGHYPGNDVTAMPISKRHKQRRSIGLPKRNFPKLLMVMLLAMLPKLLMAQPTRQGALDLSYQEGDAMIISGYTPSNPIESLANTPFTIEMWVKMELNGDNDMVLFSLEGGAFKLGLTWVSNSYFAIDAHGGNLNNQRWIINNLSETPNFIGNWNHIAFASDGSEGFAIYLNGNRIAKGFLSKEGLSRISKIFPGTNPVLKIGGKQINGPVVGKLFVSEVRVWREELGLYYIQEFYNEEVNPSHPSWNNLYRYYHCTNDYLNNNVVYIPGAIDDYLGYDTDATVTDNLVNRVKTTQYPPICPPSIKNSYSTTKYSSVASKCSVDGIEINWDDINDKNSFNYLLNNDVNYELVREDNTTSVIYDGQNNTFTDTNAQPGEKFKYRLRTYWEINGTKYYSKSHLWSDYGTMKNIYAAPELTTSSDNCDGSIKLTWTAAYTPPAWILQQSTTSDFSEGILILASNLSGDKNTYTDIPPTINADYYYRIVATGTDDNGCAVEATWSDIATGFSAGLPSKPTDVFLTPDTDAGTITISWTPADASAESWIIKRTDEDGTNAVEFADITTNSYTDNSVISCKVYKYSVGAVNNCSLGEYFVTKTASISTTELDNKMNDLMASKGYYGDGVQLNWSINGNYSNIDGYILSRSESGSNNYQTIASLDNLQELYKDETALGGMMYDYRIQATASCLDEVVYSNDVEDLGFTIPYGVANGHVEYEGGNAVQNAKISIEPKEGLGGKSLYLDGVNDYVKIENFNGVEGNNARTLEAWIKLPENSRAQTILYYGYWDISTLYQNFMLGVDNFGNLQVSVRGGSYSVAPDLRDGQWHHIACVVPQAADKIFNVKLFVDGIQSTEEISSGNCGINTVSTGDFYIGGDVGFSQKFYQGYIDEVRFWNTARTDEEILQNYGRILNGNESGLIGYWRCDEGTGNKIYDASKTKLTYNKHDGVFNNGVVWTDEIPSADKLGITAISDKYGDYSADYIPYRQGGELYRVTPSIGVHEFSPNSRTIFLGDGDATQNNLDFKDISSFTVSGKVTYYNSTFPVKGVQILIDGTPATGIDNNIETTDEYGKFEVDVPIGYHYISVEKDGHVFSSGYFPPKNTSGQPTFYEFKEDLNGLEFVDSTQVRILGRVVGGNVEGDKEVGFGLSNNNIGISDVVFKAQNEAYDLDVADANLFSIKTVQTDAATGEFEINLIPEAFEIQKAGNTNYTIDVNELSSLDLSTSLIPVVVYDSTFIDIGSKSYYEVDSTWYNHKLNFIVREVPQINITDLNGNDFVGDTVIYLTNQLTGELDTLDLTSSDPYQHPFFQMGKTYTTKIEVYEEYSNPDHPDGAVVDKVPVDNATLTINNGLEITEIGITASTDETGTYTYSFRAGIPNISKDETVPDNSFTKLFQVYATTDKVTVEWRESDPFRGYILGAFPIEGTDFVTYGYEVPEIVLRDPPGSNSYAYIEQGSSYTKTDSWEFNYDATSGIDHTVHNGIRLGYGGGLAGPLIQTELTMDSEGGIEITRDTDQKGNYTKKVKFNRRIETSSDPEDVGSEADLFIGHATNAYFTQSKNLKLLPLQYCLDNGLDYIDVQGAAYVLGIIDGIVMDEGSTPTYFVYSQRHILSELIPDLIVLRDNLLQTAKYESHLPRTSPYYGLNNDDNSLTQYKLDSIALNSSVDTLNFSYSFLGTEEEVDSVNIFNTQITYWMNAIATNEVEKANAITYNNISIDGTAGAYSESITESFDSQFNWRSARKLKLIFNAGFNNVTSGNGYNGKTKFNLNMELVTGTNQESENSVTFGYVIDEHDAGDYYSIDLKKQQGIGIYSYEAFTDNITSKDDFLLSQAKVAAIGLGSFMTSTSIKTLIGSLSTKSVYWASVATFGLDFAFFTYELGDMSFNTISGIYDDMESNNSWNVSGFDISSPIFAVRGGQSKCPYQGEENTFLTVNSQGNLMKLNTATLQREIPVIEVEKSLITDVPESNKANFTLKLQNHSSSNSDAWYELSVDDATNPHGAILLIDGVSPEKEFLVPAWETVTKTLTVQMGEPEVFDYDSIALIFHSTCQYDPTNTLENIADTAYISVHFTPTCTPVDIKGMQDNWVLNYDDNGEMAVTLTGYDVNFSTLEKLQFQYKTLSGNAISSIAYFANEDDSYNDYTGNKALLSGNAEENYTWDVSSLNDRTYLIRARSTCSDGSYYESDWYTGLIDSKPPKVFGKPEPGDGILSPDESISIRFDEELEQGIITENNFSITGVLNGSEISHNTSLHFDGINDYATVNSGVVLTDKSFTVESWIRRDAQNNAVLLSQGENTNTNLEIGIDASNQFYITINGVTYFGDASAAYSTTYPWNSWHHYAVSYSKESQLINLFVDDKTIASISDVNIEYATTGKLYIGKSIASNGKYFEGNMHELRIWNDALTFSEVYSQMYQSLSGREAGAYRIWEMNEGNGTIIAEKVRNQVMNLNTEWSVEPAGKAITLDGSQYLELNGSNAAVDSEMDLTIEFWFKGSQPSSEVTLFSNGKGDGVEVQGVTAPENCMSISALANGYLVINSNGNVIEAVNQNVMDDNWHHFALVVNRSANATTYIDGNLQKSVSSDLFAQFAGAKYFTGVRAWKTDPVTYSFDQYFTGTMDEIRTWNTARTAKQIKMYYQSRLSGEETGLTGYYPFEHYETVMGIPVLTDTWGDQWINELGSNNGVAVPHGSLSIGDIAAEIKDARPVQKVSFDYAVNGDEIILTPTMPTSRLENIILEVSVKDVYDLNGNRLLSPVSWTAYVDQNQVVWDQESVSLDKELYKPQSFTANVVNMGGSSQEYTISNLPDWLTASVTDGVIEPGKEQVITFNINEAINPGNYDQTIYLSTDYGYNEALNIKLSVYIPEPDWSVSPADYEYSMIAVGQLKIANDYAVDEKDMIAAFAGDECRGVAHVKYNSSRDAYYVFLTVYSNSVTEDLHYKVWDASAGEIYTDVTPEINFESNKLSGSIASPVLFECGYLLNSSINLNKGWSWISFNRTMGNYTDVNTLFSKLTVGDGDILKTNSSYAVYDDAFSMWLSSGLTPQAGVMYKIKLSSANTLDYEGQYINASNEDITIVNGWNRIGYLPQTNIEINQAMSGYDALEGDVLKSQTTFALFDGTEWFGSLNYLKPGDGYMLWSQTASPVVFSYPNKSTMSSLKSGSQDEPLYTRFAEYSVNPYQFPGSVSITAHLNANNLAEGTLVGAFVDNELRGVGKIEHQASGYSDYILMTAFGDEKDSGSPIRFALISDGKALNVNGNAMYQNDDFVGNLSQPVELWLNDTDWNQSNVVNVYPNPFKQDVSIQLVLLVDSEVNIGLYTVSGERVMAPIHVQKLAGNHVITLTESDFYGNKLTEGIYIVRIEINSQVYQYKLVKTN